MEKNDIYELSQLLGNQNGLENDFSQIITTLRDTLQKKYIQKLHATASARQNDVIEHPPREVTLLRAMKAFTNDIGKQQMDNMIQALLFLQSMARCFLSFGKQRTNITSYGSRPILCTDTV